MMSSRRLIAMQPIGKTDSSISSDEAKNLRSVENYFLERDTRIEREKQQIAQNFHYFSRLTVYIHINVVHVCFNILNVLEIKS